MLRAAKDEVEERWKETEQTTLELDSVVKRLSVTRE